jgi:hypothetical protein
VRVGSVRSDGLVGSRCRRSSNNTSRRCAQYPQIIEELRQHAAGPSHVRVVRADEQVCSW